MFDVKDAKIWLQKELGLTPLKLGWITFTQLKFMSSE